MIGLVLDDARRIVSGPQFNPLPVPVERAHLDLAGARHPAPDIRECSGTPPSPPRISEPTGDDLRIDERHRLGVAFLAPAAIERGHEQPDALVHLRRRQADAVILDHRLHHVVDELLDGRACGCRRVERPAPWRGARDGPCARPSEST